MCAIDYKATTAGSFDLGVGLALNDNKAINVSACFISLSVYIFNSFQMPGLAPGGFKQADALIRIPGAAKLYMAVKGQPILWQDNLMN